MTAASPTPQYTPSPALAEAIFDGSADSVMIFKPIRDRDGVIVDLRWTALNPAATRLGDMQPDDFIGKSLLAHMPRDEIRQLIARHARVIETGQPLTIEIDLPRPDGSTGWFNVHSRRFRDDDGDALLVIFRDTSERRAYDALLDQIRAEQEALQQQAMRDPLTGLANRLLLDARLDRALARLGEEQASIAVMFLDVDRLKAVNDTHGHRVGDLLLAELARRLTVGVRAYDTIARIGGDEFVIVCENISDGDIPRVARRLLNSCTTPFVLEGLSLEVSASLGVTVATDAGRDPATLIADADTAMYVAKQAGGDQIQFHLADMT